jgi:hypothetical protein
LKTGGDCSFFEGRKRFAVFRKEIVQELSEEKNDRYLLEQRRWFRELGSGPFNLNS